MTKLQSSPPLTAGRSRPRMAAKPGRERLRKIFERPRSRDMGLRAMQALEIGAPMRTPLLVAANVAFAIALSAVGGARRHTTAHAAARLSEGQDTSTADDQVDLAVTVYNSDVALVFDLRFMDIAATVNPATVHFRSVTEPSRVNVLEQNYEYDLLEPDKLLRKYVGREVTLIRMRRDDNATREEEVKAR